MGRIKSKDTKPELIVRSFLHSKGLRFRLHVKNLPGKPDLVFPKYKVVVEVLGCFWHRHEGCIDCSIPKTNTEYWISKFEKNVSRDLLNRKKLTDLGWRVIIIWDCELNDESNLGDLYFRIIGDK